MALKNLSQLITIEKSKLSVSTPVNTEGQYHKIRDKCLAKGILWEDKDFPATAATVFPDDPNGFIEWKRPKEIVKNPALFTGGASRFDVEQGELGDCWVLAAVASLSMHPQLFQNVVPSDQDFEKNYCGAFYFRFWTFGEWQEVIVDDRLPVNGSQIKFMHSNDPNEFWSALLEKAYAKANGSYNALSGGTQSEAFEDFTGGTCHTVDLTTDPDQEKLWQTLMKGKAKSMLGGCSIETDTIEEELSTGLLGGHAYSVTDLEEINHNGRQERLLRIRNPWGDTEWNGAWSDNSKELKSLTQTEKKQLNIVLEDDGEFWMSFNDFLENFTKLELCYLTAASIQEDLNMSKKKKKKWEVTSFTGAWVKNSTAGGCRNNKDTFHRNPQFTIQVTDPDPDDEHDDGTIIISLTQKDMRRRQLDFLSIGYAIYGITEAECGNTLDQKFFLTHKMAAKSWTYLNARSMCDKHVLTAGHYVIMPTTFNKNEEAEFLLRIVSSVPYKSTEVDEKCAIIQSNDKPMLKMDLKDPGKKDKVEALRSTFNVVSNGTGFINAIHLQQILDEAFKRSSDVSGIFKGFSKEACRSMLCLLDTSGDGKVEFEEFYEFWHDIVKWKRIFIAIDEDKSGSFTAFELKEALKAAGFQTSSRVFNRIVIRYSDPRDDVIHFEDFIVLLIRIRATFHLYMNIEKDNQGHLIVDDDAFLAERLYM